MSTFSHKINENIELLYLFGEPFSLTAPKLKDATSAKKEIGKRISGKNKS